MKTKNYKDLLIGTLVAAVTLLITSYLYYNVINEAPANASAWGSKILYSLVLGFGIGYICWKSKKTTKSHVVTGLVVGLLLGLIILAASRLVSLNSEETIVCCRGNHCWFMVLQVMVATAAAAATGKTGSGGDD